MTEYIRSDDMFDEKTKSINRIKFEVLTNNEIKKISAVNKDQYGIDEQELVENHEPKNGGLNDRRLGVTSRDALCKTCELPNKTCPTHFGHIELAKQIFHYPFLDTIKDVMSMICIRCSNLLISDKMKEEIKNSNKLKSRSAKNAELKRIIKNSASSIKDCAECGTVRMKIKKNVKGTVIEIIAERDDKKDSEDDSGGKDGDKSKKGKIRRQVLTPTICYETLKNIKDEDAELLGLSVRPEELITTYLPVAPVGIRPSARTDTSATVSEDKLTGKYMDIIKFNKKIRDMMNQEGVTESSIAEFWSLLQYHCAIFYDSSSNNLMKSEQNKVPFVSLESRLEDKEGRIRGNLNGKRVNFSSRDVITPDPNLALDELGVPLKIAMTQTFPEKVTEKNIDRLNKLVKNGRKKYPGANYVIAMSSAKKEGSVQVIDLGYRRKEIPLKIGDIVERHMQDGDIGLFNRQPSLHKMSMMAMKVKVLKKGSSFRFNPNGTRPFNADFFRGNYFF